MQINHTTQSLPSAKEQAERFAIQQTLFWTVFFGLTSIPLVMMSDVSGWYLITLLPFFGQAVSCVRDRRVDVDVNTTGTISGDVAKYAYLPHLRPTVISRLVTVVVAFEFDLVLYWIFAWNCDVSHQTIVLLTTLTAIYLIAFFSFSIWVAYKAFS